jgi:hypothetical protein
VPPAIGAGHGPVPERWQRGGCSDHFREAGGNRWMLRRDAWGEENGKDHYNLDGIVNANHKAQQCGYEPVSLRALLYEQCCVLIQKQRLRIYPTTCKELYVFLWCKRIPKTWEACQFRASWLCHRQNSEPKYCQEQTRLSLLQSL